MEGDPHTTLTCFFRPGVFFGRLRPLLYLKVDQSHAWATCNLWFMHSPELQKMIFFAHSVRGGTLYFQQFSLSKSLACGLDKGYLTGSIAALCALLLGHERSDAMSRGGPTNIPTSGLKMVADIPKLTPNELYGCQNVICLCAWAKLCCTWALLARDTQHGSITSAES